MKGLNDLKVELHASKIEEKKQSTLTHLMHMFKYVLTILNWGLILFFGAYLLSYQFKVIDFFSLKASKIDIDIETF